MESKDIQKLAALARISVDEGELPKLTHEFDAILAYVGQLEKLDISTAPGEKPPLRNVMREDGEPHETGKFTEKLVEQFPAREGDSLSVKQIITHE
jgi:aspartyl/glutamyl-tRNA(Asn/Gln) amidotransferase C subunit